VSVRFSRLLLGKHLLLPGQPTNQQVEHGITEMVNGDVDIVEWMLRLQLPQFMAPLHFEQMASELKRSGWSIEVWHGGQGAGSQRPCGAPAAGRGHDLSVAWLRSKASVAVALLQHTTD
jgi:hypothetical protein